MKEKLLKIIIEKLSKEKDLNKLSLSDLTFINIEIKNLIQEKSNKFVEKHNLTY